MEKFKDTLIVTGSLGEIKIYEVKESERTINNEIKTVYSPELVSAADIIEAHRKLGETVTDKAGRFGHGSGEEHALQNERVKRIIAEAAADITAVVKTKRPKAIYLAYPQEHLRELEEKLPKEVSEKILKALGADLVKTPREKLLEHFA